MITCQSVPTARPNILVKKNRKKPYPAGVGFFCFSLIQGVIRCWPPYPAGGRDYSDVAWCSHTVGPLNYHCLKIWIGDSSRWRNHISIVALRLILGRCKLHIWFSPILRPHWVTACGIIRGVRPFLFFSREYPRGYIHCWLVIKWPLSSSSSSSSW